MENQRSYLCSCCPKASLVTKKVEFSPFLGAQISPQPRFLSLDIFLSLPSQSWSINPLAEVSYDNEKKLMLHKQL
jgi:hypothetical protein